MKKISIFLLTFVFVAVAAFGALPALSESSSPISNYPYEDSCEHIDCENEGVFVVDSYDELDSSTFVKNFTDFAEQTRAVGDQFNSSELAALDFATNYYKFCEYTRVEWAATIYRKSGKYYYHDVHFGAPHSVGVSNTVPSGATYVGYIHTHPNSENFSQADKDAAQSLGGFAYVVTPSYSVRKYNPVTGRTTKVGAVIPKKLDIVTEAVLAARTRSAWFNHFVNGICPSHFGCENKSWPNEQR